MAKKSHIQRELKRKKCVAKFAVKRAELKTLIKDMTLSDDVRFDAVEKLQQLPRNSSKCRIRNRCQITGRSRGVYKKFGLGRSMLRILAMKGEIPGVVKSSW